MKKALAILIGLMSVSALADETKPRLKLGVYDTSTQVAKDIGLTYSVSNPKLMLCWTAGNMKFDAANRNQVVELVEAPSAAANFAKSGATVRRLDNKISISSTMPAVNNEYVHHCWKFDNTDPLGKYKLSVQVNEIAFGAIEFELVK